MDTKIDTATTARDLARELREHLYRLAPSGASHIHIAINATRGHAIAATLEALASENERLQDENVAALTLIEMYRVGDFGV